MIIKEHKMENEMINQVKLTKEAVFFIISRISVLLNAPMSSFGPEPVIRTINWRIGRAPNNRAEGRQGIERGVVLSLDPELRVTVNFDPVEDLETARRLYQVIGFCVDWGLPCDIIECEPEQRVW
jgi:hypothetical protein